MTHVDLLAPPVSESPVTFRDLTDVPATRQAIFDNVLQAAAAFEPIRNDRYELALRDVRYVGPERYSERDRKQAVLSRGTLGRPLQGVWELRDLQGGVLGRKRAVLARVPYLTDDGTYVYNGTDYGLSNQFRLRPGVYTRRKDSGELEAHFNVKRGRGHKLFLDPATGLFKIKVQQSEIPALPLLQALGVPSERIREAWGKDLYALNSNKPASPALDKFVEKFVGARRTPNGDKLADLRQAIEQMEVDPDVTRRTLGTAFSRVNGDVLLAASSKLLAINQGKARTDFRDALPYQQFMGPEDLFREGVRDARNDVRKAFWRLARTGDVKKLPSGLMNAALRSVLMDSGLGQPLEQINPLEVLDQTTRVTRLGRGGLPGTDAIPMAARNVHPSQLGFVDTLRTAESLKVGIDQRFAAGVRKGSDGQLYMPVVDAKTGEQLYRNPAQMADAVVTTASELAKPVKHVLAFVNGEIEYTPRANVQLVLPSMDKTYSALSGLVAKKQGIKGGRAVMAARMISQAMPVENPESPLVQNRDTDDPEGRSMEYSLGSRVGAVRAELGGRVMSVDPDSIVVQYTDGKTREYELANNRPFNRKTLLHNVPVVRAGDAVQPGQLLARSNFSDAEGRVALGRNPRVALVADGYNYEDAITMSQSYADGFRSEHAYQHAVDWSDRIKRGKRTFTTLHPGAFTKEALAKLDDDGVVRPGQTVEYGDPLVLAAEQRQRTRKSLHRGGRDEYADVSLRWEHHQPGVVTDAVANDRGVNVVVKSYMPIETGDKISARQGNKGVVVVRPDDEMPVGEDGRPFDVLLNPLGTISRGNPSALVELALGKLAEKLGKPITVDDFDTEDAREQALARLQQHGLKDSETIIYPKTGTKIPRVLTGRLYMMKLHHTTAAKAQGRGLGGYTSEGQPSKAGEDSAKRLGMLQLHAMVAHGATEVLRDATLVRGQAKPEDWAKFMTGYELPQPKVPFVYQRFVNMLRQAGINPVRQGTKTQLMALTPKDVDELVGDRELTNAETVDWKTFEPVAGGLFDKTLTGGHGDDKGGGDRWAFIRLPRPMPNPLMEEPIRRLLGLTKQKYFDVLTGKEEFRGRRGADALVHSLKSLNLDEELQKARSAIASGKKTQLDAAVKRLKYLKAAKRLGMSFDDWVWDKVPVIPPRFRPVSTVGDKGLPLVADANYLYKEVFNAKDIYNRVSEKFGEDAATDELGAVYKAVQAVTGFGEPTSQQLVERNVRGALKQIVGSSPKFGYVQRKLLGKTVDLVGRSVIAPDPDLRLDEVGIPEEKAWKSYQPFVLRNLRRRGKTVEETFRAFSERTPLARQALEEELGKRPVLVSRDPVLHRFGFMALKPKLVRGNTMLMNPLVYPGYGADNDGDALNYHVVADDRAAEEALRKMLPSANLFASSDFKAHYKPQQEYLAGLYEASTRVDDDRPAANFSSVEDVLRAYRAGELDLWRRVVVADTRGRDGNR